MLNNHFINEDGNPLIGCNDCKDDYFRNWDGVLLCGPCDKEAKRGVNYSNDWDEPPVSSGSD